ncbi:hypothetical protein C0995_010518 [Termitomyces sp. Mi166|nr:hypothetical protein C0995_010518 [Termitomyces sp. Mi166\
MSPVSRFGSELHEPTQLGQLMHPQCGTKYDIINQSRIMRLLGLGNRILQRADPIVRLVGVAGMVRVFTSGVYRNTIMYGKWAVEQFTGMEYVFPFLQPISSANFGLRMQALLNRSDDPAVWYWTTFISIPSVPLNLILACFQPPILISSISLVLLLWPLIPADIRISHLWSSTLWNHPPTPAFFGFMFVSLVRYAYRRVWTYLRGHVLSRVLPSGYSVRDTIVWDGLAIPEVNNGGAAQQQQGLRQDEDETIMVIPSLVQIGGALVVPWISNHMGALLLCMSKHSTILRQILAVEPQG